MRFPPALTAHRCHDVPFLLRRWRTVARAARLTVTEIHDAGGYPVLFLRPAALTPRALYFSSGMHGDEPAGALGLLEWAEKNVVRVRRHPVVFFPLLNPWGLANNSRLNHQHIDLNRRFHDAHHPHIAAWWRFVEPLEFAAGICLHEDYDARGMYCYELNRVAHRGLADTLLSACAHILPRDSRRRIDISRARNGVIRRRRLPDLPGLPEAIALYMHNAPITMTFETPSEFALHDRVAAHVAFVEAVWRTFAGR